MTTVDTRKLRRRIAGVAFLALMALLVTLSVQIYRQTFVGGVLVTLHADRTGNQLNRNADVKARGVLVGHVRQIRHTDAGADVILALEPDRIGRIRRDVTALLVPKTLFGERYVQLSIQDGSTAPPLAAGDQISQDRSANAIELERVFDDLLPVLRAVQPSKLATALSVIAGALDGRGERLGTAISTAAGYLAEFNPNLPTLTQDIGDLARVSDLYGDIAPDVLDALTDAAVTLNTVDEQRSGLDALYGRVTGTSQDLTRFLAANKENLIRLTAAGRAPLAVVARYSPSFPCTLKALTDLKPAMDRVLGAGTGQPGLHVEVSVTQPRGKYLPGVDRPVYNATGGPKCYPSGVAPGAGITPSVTDTTPVGVAAPLSVGSGEDLGLPNSPQERELLATLLAPELGVDPGDVPAWSGVLVGPLYRGTEVTVR